MVGIREGLEGMPKVNQENRLYGAVARRGDLVVLVKKYCSKKQHCSNIPTWSW